MSSKLIKSKIILGCFLLFIVYGIVSRLCVRFLFRGDVFIGRGAVKDGFFILLLCLLILSVSITVIIFIRFFCIIFGVSDQQVISSLIFIYFCYLLSRDWIYLTDFSFRTIIDSSFRQTLGDRTSISNFT